MPATLRVVNIPPSAVAKPVLRGLLLAVLFATASLNSLAQNITVSPATLTFAKTIVGVTAVPSR